MPPRPAKSGMDKPNRRFVAAILRAHITGGTLPPRWTATQLIERGTAVGLNIAVPQLLASPIGGDQ